MSERLCNITFFLLIKLILQKIRSLTIFASYFNRFMIQRIQSIYLLLAGLAVWSMLIFPFAAFSSYDTILAILDAFGLKGEDGTSIESKANIGMLIAIPAIGMLIFWNIFQYKNRSRQLKLGRLIYLMLAGMIVAVIFSVRAAHSNFPEAPELQYGPSYFMPIVALLFNFLALRAIKGDHDLLNSLDRLR